MNGMEGNALPITKQALSYKPTALNFNHEPTLKTTYINNRRYLGNKYKLLPFIKSVVAENCEGVISVADIFAGTGAVASAFTDKQLITNDNLYSNYICHLAWFSPQSYSQEKIKNLITHYNALNIADDNYMSANFSDTFFSLADCRKIGFIREDIETRYTLGEINERERALLITALLYAADKIANTCGHYDAFRQGVEFEKNLELSIPLPNDSLNDKNICYNEDTNELIKRIAVDLVYIDPPYNSRQYCVHIISWKISLDGRNQRFSALHGKWTGRTSKVIIAQIKRRRHLRI